MKLEHLQILMQQLILTGDEQHLAELTDSLRSSNSRFAIYYSGYRTRMRESLIAQYPCTVKLLGDLFDMLSDIYMEKFVSTSYSTREFGFNFWCFLKKCKIEHSVELSELARFEVALATVFDALDQKVMSIDSLVNLSELKWPSLKLKLIDASKLFVTHYNVAPVWRALTQNIEPVDWKQANDAVTIFLWRTDKQVLFETLDETEAFFLAAQQHRICFADLCERLCKNISETQVPAVAMTLLQKWLIKGAYQSSICNKNYS